jgi:hypothetical protein
MYSIFWNSRKNFNKKKVTKTKSSIATYFKSESLDQKNATLVQHFVATLLHSGATPEQPLEQLQSTPN